MDLPESELHVGKAKKIIQFIPKGLMWIINRIWGKKAKIEYSIWKASIEPNIVHIKMEKSACAVSVRSDTPVGIIAAEFVYTIISDYLDTEISSMNDKQKLGIAMWYMVHYLYIMDYERYGNFYDKAIEQFTSLDQSDLGRKNEIFKNWNLEGKAEYLAARERIHPKNAPIMPISLGISKIINSNE